jgi:hypothetical protein
MSRRKNMTVALAIALVMAAIAPVSAQAMLSGSADYPAWAKEIEAPYWFSKTESRTDYPAWAKEIVAPYSFSPTGTVVKSPDDRSFARGTVEPTQVVSDNGRSIELNSYTASGFVLTLLLAIGGGMGLGVWYTRKATPLAA